MASHARARTSGAHTTTAFQHISSCAYHRGAAHCRQAEQHLVPEADPQTDEGSLRRSDTEPSEESETDSIDWSDDSEAGTDDAAWPDEDADEEYFTFEFLDGIQSINEKC